MERYDYIIVGSGSAGGFLTYRLSEDPNLRILLLEAGPSDKHWTTRIPAGNRYTFEGGPRTWSFATEPEPYMNGRRLDQPRGKCLGGSSSLNGMVYVRGHPEDYAGWEADGAAGWGWEDCLPAFKSLERFVKGANDTRGGTGPIRVLTYDDGNHPIEDAFLEAGQQAGWANPEDYNSGVQEGVMAFDANINGGWRSGTGRECVEPARRRANVSVVTGAFASSVMLEGTRAVGVRYRYKGRDMLARAEREVLLAAGGFQSPQLLMLSGIGPADHLRSHGIAPVVDLPGVGANLQDHLEVHLKYRCKTPGISKNVALKRHNILKAGIEWMLTKTGTAASGPSRVGGFFRSSSAASHPDIQFHFWPYFLEGWAPPPDKDGYCFDVGPVTSEARGWVKLGSSDPFAPPRIQLNGLAHDSDIDRFVRAIEIARDIEAQSAFDFCRGPEVSPGLEATSRSDLEAYVRANANSAYHPCGTCKMGGDAMAVVDPEARVQGVEGLRVVDASIMPRIPNGNINAPSMMIGERVAGMIRAAL